VTDAAQTRGLTVRFPRRGTAVLRELSLTIAPGEQVIVFGPSGAGKSTLLHALAGVIPHSVVATVDGTVHIFGRDTAEVPVVELSREVGVVAQDPQSSLCLPDVEQELALPLENRAVPPEQISALIDEALAAVDGAAFRRRATGQLSGGETQRVALAAGLIGGQRLLLLDEPTSMLDAAGIHAVRSAIAGAVAATHPAVVLIEHRIDEFAGDGGIAALPARALVLGADGRLLADGPTPQVLAQYGAELHTAGCWLPLETELAAVFGTAGGLDSVDVRRGLAALAPPRPADEADEADGRDEADGAGVAVPAPATVVLEASTLTVGHSATEPTLSGISLTLHSGEIVAVLGANGVGKSTLLLTLAGLLPPLAGTVSGARPGMIFQNPEHQFVANTVRAEVAFGLPAGSGELVTQQLQAHRLSHLADQVPHRLSGGEKRRLSVAAMLAHHRPTLLADEPTFGLDRHATISTGRALRQAAAGGRSILFSSHDIRTVATVADRIILVAEGTVIADAPVDDILRDEAVLARAGIVVPPLVRWLLAATTTPAALRHALDALDNTIVAAGPLVGSVDESRAG